MYKPAAMTLLCAAISIPLSAEAGLWLSDQPPDKSLMRDMKRSHGGYVLIEDDVYVKQLWLRKGDSLTGSAYAEPAGASFSLLDTRRQLSEPAVGRGNGAATIRFKMPEEGYYNAYYTERAVENGVLNVATAKAEILKHNCRLGHNYDRKLVEPGRWQDAPLEIVRLRLPDEDFHTRIRSGNLLKFSVQHQGQPVRGATVRLETQKGWINTAFSDENGIASFQVIQDTFPVDDDDGARFLSKPQAGEQSEKRGDEEKEGRPGKWAGQKDGLQSEGGKPSKWQAKKDGDEHAEHKGDHGERKEDGGNSRWGGERREDHFLVSAEYLSDEAGAWEGQAYRQIHYSTAMTGSYAPNIQVSQSKSLGLIYASAGMLTLGVGATVYRRRRIKPFKEVGFDER
ncbi:MAG: hypothetical protein LUQ11_02010 [Methylococcaceae bacterium]|nr:hypothetical protein [Methylococcaceae bacterium]